MSYYEKTQQLLQMYDANGKNMLRHFFAQLTQVRELYSYALMNAITIVDDATSVSELILNSVTVEPWMQHVVMADIRNVVCFMVLKEFNTVINTEIVVNDGPSVIGGRVKDLEILMETCYYIRHIFLLIHGREDIDMSWTMCHDFFHEQPLTDSCRLMHELLQTLKNDR